MRCNTHASSRTHFIIISFLSFFDGRREWHLNTADRHRSRGTSREGSRLSRDSSEAGKGRGCLCDDPRDGFCLRIYLRRSTASAICVQRMSAMSRIRRLIKIRARCFWIILQFLDYFMRNFQFKRNKKIWDQNNRESRVNSREASSGTSHLLPKDPEPYKRFLLIAAIKEETTEKYFRRTR